MRVYVCVRVCMCVRVCVCVCVSYHTQRLLTGSLFFSLKY